MMGTTSDLEYRVEAACQDLVRELLLRLLNMQVLQ
jgi:hypothetical protein